MAILMLSHLIFFPILSLQKYLYFIPSLLDEENRTSLLFVFYIYFKPIFKQDRTKWGILFVFSHIILQNRLFYPYFSLGGKGDDLLLFQNRHKRGYENPILFESTLTNDKIALKYTILFLFMDVGLTPVFFIAKICIK